MVRVGVIRIMGWIHEMIDRNSWHYKARKYYYVDIDCVSIIDKVTIIGYWFDVFFMFPMTWLKNKIPFIKEQKFKGKSNKEYFNYWK